MTTMDSFGEAVPTNEAICEIANLVWQCFVDPEGTLVPSSIGPSGEGFVANVSVTGSWDGHVSLMLPRHLAQVAVRAMLERDAESDEEFLDGIGELGNVIGGNIKSVLAVDCAMTPPTVRASQELRSEEQAAALSMDLAWDERPMRIAITPNAVD